MNSCNSTPIFLAYYSDTELSQQLKGVKPEEVDDRLTAIIKLFNCLMSKDAFLNRYQKHLAERLINKTLLAMDYEESMLQKLKMEVGIN